MFRVPSIVDTVSNTFVYKLTFDIWLSPFYKSTLKGRWILYDSRIEHEFTSLLFMLSLG